MAVTELFSWKEILGCASFNNETGTWKESAEACTLMGGRSKDKNEKNLLVTEYWEFNDNESLIL